MPRTASKNGRARRSARAASKPTIGEIKTVLEDHIHMLVTSFSEFGPKDRGLVARIGIDAAASVKRCSPEIQKEIACLQRAIELLAPQALECGEGSPLSLSALRALEECPPLTKEQKAAFNKLTAADWTQEDWADLYNSMECVILRVCHRHGITNSVPRGTSRYPVLSAAEATTQSIKSLIPKL